jgi:uncharacterized protein (DUF58 family)
MSFQLLTVVAAAAGMGMIGLTYDAYAAYFMCSALIALVGVAFASSRLSGRVLEVRREVADRVFANERFPVLLELTNRGRVPLFLVRALETLSPFLIPDQTPEFLVPALWPGETVQLSYRLRGQKRGAHSLGPLRVAVCDPFGLFARRVPLETPGEAVIFPRPVPVGGEVVRMGAEPRPIASGERARGSEAGLEFYGIRDYAPGDELRRIHWPATAHHGRLTVIEFDRGSSENIGVVVDTRAGTDFGVGLETTLDLAVRAAASLATWALSGDGSACVIADSAAGVKWLEVDRLDRADEMLELLARAQADGTMSLAGLLEWARPLLPTGATLWVITAAPDGVPAEAVAALARDREVSAVAVLVVDARSFDRRLPAEAASGADLSATGALTATVGRGDDLGDVLGNVLSASS